MIDVWILTVVVIHDRKGINSFQLKFYSEQEAIVAEEMYSDRPNWSVTYCDTIVTKTQEQKIN